jgi:hypothetical protein
MPLLDLRLRRFENRVRKSYGTKGLGYVPPTGGSGMARAIPPPIMGYYKQSEGGANPEGVAHPPTHLGGRPPEAPAPFRDTSGGWEAGKFSLCRFSWLSNHQKCTQY